MPHNQGGHCSERSARHLESGPTRRNWRQPAPHWRPSRAPQKNCDGGLSFLLLGCWQDSDSCSKCSLLRCILFVKIELYTCGMWTYLYVYYASVFYQKNLSFSVFPLPQGNFCNQFLVSFLSYFKHMKTYIYYFPYKYCMNHTSVYFFSPFHFICLVNCSISAFFFFNWSGSILLALNYKIGGLKEKQFSKTSCWMMEVLDKRIHALWYQLYEVLYNGKWMYGWDKIRTVVVSGGMWVGLTKKGPEGNI